MSFTNFLNEMDDGFIPPNSNQMSLLRQEIDKSVIVENIKKSFDDQGFDINIVNNEIYVSGIKMENEDDVVIKLSVIAEVKSEDGYIYYKPVHAIHNIEKEKTYNIKDDDRVRDENWKTIQEYITKDSKKI